MIKKWSATIAIVLAWMPVALAQTPSPTASENPTITTRTNLVLVPALVRTRSGQVVFTLTANDFTVTDNGVEQKVSLEEDTDDQPLALVVLIETGGDGARMLDTYRNLGPMIDTVVGNVPHKVAVVAFDSAPRIVQDFTSDSDAVGDAINALKAGNSRDAILDSLRFAVDLLRKQPPTYRRAILLISETIDHGSHSSLEDALQSISDTNTSIYSVAFPSTRGGLKNEVAKFSSDTPGPAGGCMSRAKAAPDPGSTTDAGANSGSASSANSGANSGSASGSNTDSSAAAGGDGQSRLAQTYDCLSELAPPLRAAKIAAMAVMGRLQRNVPETVTELTGGEYYKFEKAKNLQNALITISNHIPNRYELSFQPQSPAPGLHTIEVRLKDYPNLDVTARHNYWADSATQ